MTDTELSAVVTPNAGLDGSYRVEREIGETVREAR